jgi:single-stranded DNA-binding protein
MVGISISGKLISDVSTKPSSNGGERSQFTLESRDEDRDALPLRFLIVVFGAQAKRAATLLKTGTQVNVFGRMTAGGESKQVTVRLFGFEIQQGAPADA